MSRRQKAASPNNGFQKQHLSETRSPQKPIAVLPLILQWPRLGSLSAGWVGGSGRGVLDHVAGRAAFGVLGAAVQWREPEHSLPPPKENGG